MRALRKLAGYALIVGGIGAVVWGFTELAVLSAEKSVGEVG